LLVGQIREGNARILVAQQGFRRKDNQRLAESTYHLAAQDVKNLGAVGRLYDLNIVVRAQLKETLDACRRVLGALAFVAVRQHHDKAALTAPFGLARRDELID